MPEKKAAAESDPNSDPTVDRYPQLGTALSAIKREANRIEGQVERLDCRFLATGEVTYNVWLVGSDDPEGGYIAAEDVA